MSQYVCPALSVALASASAASFLLLTPYTSTSLFLDDHVSRAITPVRSLGYPAARHAHKLARRASNLRPNETYDRQTIVWANLLDYYCEHEPVLIHQDQVRVYHESDDTVTFLPVHKQP